ncbi:hypothetical protein AAVH_31682 [Aphelenchoides avenae]|nr:hypothetical protein AAVH_31682 [Aphelenchus avenae]
MTTEPNARPRVSAPSAYLEITDDSKYGWEPNCVCSKKTPGHEDCITMTLAHLEPAYKGKDIGSMQVLSFLQLLMCMYALRDGFGNFTESFLCELLEELEGIEESAATSAIHTFNELCKHRSFQTMPTSEDIYRSIEKRARFCKKARETLIGKMMSEVFDDEDDTKYRPIKYNVNVHEFGAELKHEWLRLMQCVPAQLERFKIAVSFPGKQRVVNPTVLIGDSVMRELRRAIKPSFYAVEGQTISEIAKRLEDTVFISGEVKKVVIATGHDDIKKKLPTDVIHNSLRQLLRCVKKYPHVDVLVTPPPYIHSQAFRERWQSFMDGFDALVQESGATAVTIVGSRCFPEIFRDGPGNDTMTVDVDGKPTALGGRKTVNFLKEVLDVSLQLHDNGRRIFTREEKKDAQSDDVLVVQVNRTNDSIDKPSTSRQAVEAPRDRDNQSNSRPRQQTHRGSQKSRKRQYDDKSDGRSYYYGKKPRK